MTYYSKLATPLAGLTILTLGSAASAQDLSQLSAVDVLKLQVAAGQTAEQLEEQLSDKLVFDAEDQPANRAKIKTYVQTLVAAAPGTTGSHTVSLPIREITYDFDQSTYKICLPSSVLTKTQVDGGTIETLISFTFTDLAEKNADACPFYKDGFKPGGALGVSNYMEIKADMNTAQKLHDAIVAESSMASFTCDQITYVQGRFDTGPTQLKCTTAKVEISTAGGAILSYPANDDNWISKSAKADAPADASSTDEGDATAAAVAAAALAATAQAEAAAAAALAEAEAAVAEAEAIAAAAVAEAEAATAEAKATAAAAEAKAAAEAEAAAAAAEAKAAAEAEAAAAAEAAAPPPMTEGTILTETALELDKAGRISVQRRLNLLGHDTRGVDGVFGPGTRAGLTQWQYKNGLPVTGYLAADQLAVLNTTSESLYMSWLAANANSSSTTSTSKKATKKRKVYRGRDGCLRRQPGNARRTIIKGQSRFCNRRRAGKI